MSTDKKKGNGRPPGRVDTLGVPPIAQETGELALLADLVEKMTTDLGTLTVHRRRVHRTAGIYKAFRAGSSAKVGWEFRVPVALEGFVPHPGFYEVVLSPGDLYPHIMLTPSDQRPPRAQSAKCTLQSVDQWRFSLPYHRQTLDFMAQHWGLPPDHKKFEAMVRVLPEGMIVLARPNPKTPAVQAVEEQAGQYDNPRE